MPMSTEDAPARSAVRPDSQDRLARLLTAVRELRSAWRDVTRSTFPAGPTGYAGYTVLNLVAQQGPSRVSDLATCAHVGVSTMSRHVADLTTAGLLDRDVDPGDGRTHVVRLTPDGDDALRRARERVLGRLAPALDGWTDEDVDRLEGQLTRLTQDLGAAVGRAPERTS